MPRQLDPEPQSSLSPKRNWLVAEREPRWVGVSLVGEKKTDGLGGKVWPREQTGGPGSI